MKWNDLKKKLNKMSKEELKQDAIFITSRKTQSGIIEVAKKLPATLYNTYEDDPNELKTMKELKEYGLDKEELENVADEFSKGQFFIEIPLNY